jgi:hypothetical protein
MLFFCLFSLLHADDRTFVSYGTVIQIRNVGSALYLASGLRNPSHPSSPLDYFGAFEPFDEGWYWNVGHITPTSSFAVKCGSIIHLTPFNRDANLAVENFFTIFRFVEQSEMSDSAAAWNVTCESQNWDKNGFVQFRNVGHDCFLGARLDVRKNPMIPNRYPLECTLKSSVMTVWIVDSGLFPQDDLNERWRFR